MQPYGFIYLVRNHANGKVYVGQTTRTVQQRWKNHKNDARRGADYPLQRAIAKYGEDAFTVETLATCADKDTLDKVERYFICEVFQSTNDLLGYNLERGGNGTGTLSESTKAKMSAGQKKTWTPERKAKQSAEYKIRWANPEYREKHLAFLADGRPTVGPLSDSHKAAIGKASKAMWQDPERLARQRDMQLGKKHSPETKAKIGAAHKGRKFSEEHLAKLSAARKGRQMSAEWRAKLGAAHKGRKRSPETRAKISAGRKGYKPSPESLAKRKATIARRRAEREAIFNFPEA